MVFPLILLLALTQSVAERKAADAANEPQQDTVCHIFENLRMYDGKVVAIQVVNLNLEGTQCQPPTATDDPRLLDSGKALLNYIDVVPFPVFVPQTRKELTLAGPFARALYDYEHWWREGYDVRMRIVGRIEVRPVGRPIGVGTQGAYPATITITQIEEMKRSAKKGPKRKVIYIE